MNHFTIIIPSYNNIKWIKETLESALNQKHDNFDVIFVDDKSDDGSYEFVRDNYDDVKNLKIIRNESRLYALYNTRMATKMAKDNSICIILDGDDKLKHESVLQYLDFIYKNPQVWMTYGSYETSNGDKPRHLRSFTTDEITKNKFREVEWLATHLRTYRKELFLKIKEDDLKDENGEYLKITGDLAQQFPMLEMAGYHSYFINEVLYIYNLNNPISDDKNRDLQYKIELDLRKRNKYNKLTKLND